MIYPGLKASGSCLHRLAQRYFRPKHLEAGKENPSFSPRAHFSNRGGNSAKEGGEGGGGSAGLAYLPGCSL